MWYDGGMPRLHGYRERLPLNIYDCVSPRQLADGEVMLFGAVNIGNQHKTNMCVSGNIASDQTAVIRNWYARTNMDTTLPAWQAWANVTTVTMIVGAKPRMQLPLSDLIKHTQGGDGLCDDPKFAITHADYIVRRDQLAYQVAQAYLGDTQMHSMPEEEIERWHRVCRAIRGDSFKEIVIPVRHTFGVRIESSQEATRALLEVMPTNVAPQSLVWVHLEGLMSRDVA